MNKHKIFILSPISGILNEAILSCKNISKGMESYPLSDYIMQSIFIKMTGAQEQKMKCIMWEIAHNDFTFRYDFLRNPQGEYSDYKDKAKVYSNLLQQITIIDKKFDIEKSIDKKDILNKSNISILLDKTILSIWSQKSYANYLQLWKEVSRKHFTTANNNLFTSMNGNNVKICLKNVYVNHLYKNRNRIAHNTKSYQHNLPTLNTLKESNFIFDNYFLWFSTLILIDHIFIDLYKVYLETLKQKKFI